MKGKVLHLNGNLCAIETDYGIVVLKITGPHSTSTGDSISGHMRTTGAATLTNETNGIKFETIIEDFDCTDEHANEFIYS